MNRSTFAFIAVCIQQAACSVFGIDHAMAADDAVLASATLSLEAEVLARGPKLILNNDITTIELNLASGSAEVTIPVVIQQSNTKGTLSICRPESNEQLPNLDLNFKGKTRNRLGLGGILDLGVIGDGGTLKAMRVFGGKPNIEEELEISASYPAGADRPYGQTVQETLTVTFTAS